MSATPGFAPITDSDLARARNDAVFRRQLLAQSLERLLAELSKLQHVTNDPAKADQVREGIELAVKLSDLLRRIGSGAIRAA
jgi:hypothetical protein